MTLQEQAKSEMEVKYQHLPLSITVGNVRKVSCEWCDNESDAVWVQFSPTKHATKGVTHIEGVCLGGGGYYFKDKSFGPQSDWHVCYKKDCPNGD